MAAAAAAAVAAAAAAAAPPPPVVVPLRSARNLPRNRLHGKSTSNMIFMHDIRV